MKVILTVGHKIINNKGTGVHVGSIDEAKECRKFVNDLISYLKYRGSIEVLTDDDTLTLTQTINWLDKVVEPEDILIDFHLNAATPQATGSEVFIAKNYNKFELTFATELSRIMSTTLGIRNRGCKTENQSQYNTLGILSGKARRANNFLAELFFATNQSDWKAYNEKYSDLIVDVGALIMSNYKYNV